MISWTIFFSNEDDCHSCNSTQKNVLLLTLNKLKASWYKMSFWDSSPCPEPSRAPGLYFKMFTDIYQKSNQIWYQKSNICWLCWAYSFTADKNGKYCMPILPHRPWQFCPYCWSTALLLGPCDGTVFKPTQNQNTGIVPALFLQSWYRKFLFTFKVLIHINFPHLSEPHSSILN